ncbi:hypothetical protein ABT382_36265 [Streptomyces pharetrae]|uniref:hypothetical protein n=1 Tax=Streptomyces pharetrae TaxID=291370 RepID=UPI003353E268
MASLRFRQVNSSIIHRPGTPARTLITGYNPRWWERITDRLTAHYDLLQQEVK